MAYIGNFLLTRLAQNLDQSSTSMTVTSGDGAKFGAEMIRLYGAEMFPYYLVIRSQSYGQAVLDPNREIVKVTARSDDTFTIERGQRGTNAVAHYSDDYVQLSIQADDVVVPLDGLINPEFTSPTYVSKTSFTVAGDVTSWLRPGRGLVITFQTSGIKRGVATSLSYDSGTSKTTINTCGDSLVNETITSVLLSLSDTEAINKNIAYIFLRKTSNQTITSGSYPDVTWNSKVAGYNDSIFSWNSGDSKVYINAPGIYIASVMLYGNWNAGSWTSYNGFVVNYKDLGTEKGHKIQGPYTSASLTFMFINPLNIRNYVYQNSGSNKTVNGNTDANFNTSSLFSITKIG